MKEVFTADQFKATRWDTAEQKAKFANQFVRFVNSGFKPTRFTHGFYQRLSRTFGHIAHYNRSGFFATWFSATAAQLEFLRRTAEWNAYGDPAYTYSDVERVLSVWVKKADLVGQYAERMENQTREIELNTLRQLQAKYPDGV